MEESAGKKHCKFDYSTIVSVKINVAFIEILLNILMYWCARFDFAFCFVSRGTKSEAALTSADH